MARSPSRHGAGAGGNQSNRSDLGDGADVAKVGWAAARILQLSRGARPVVVAHLVVRVAGVSGEAQARSG